MVVDYKTIQDVENDELFALFSQADLFLFTDIEPLNSKHQVFSLRLHYLHPQRKAFFICVNNQVVGFVSAWLISKHRTAVVTCVLQQSHQRKGIITAALSYMHQYLFSACNVYRIEAQVYEANMASVALFRSLGYTQEGLLRSNFVIQGKSQDSYIFSLLASDSAACK